MLKRLQNLSQRLDETQLKAVKHGEGPLLVTAGPGSGKTTVITHHIKYLIEHLGISPKEILVITFTKAAATEMKERFLHMMKERSTQVVFGTFQAFFYQIQCQSGGLNQNSILKEKEKYMLLKDILKGHNLLFYENTFLDDLISEISQVQNKGNLENYKPILLEKDVFIKVYREYHERKKALNKIDFDDMVSDCHTILLQHEHILRKWQDSFRFILVDEFQDINPLQYEIVKLLADKHHNVFAVGDEDQSIYSFRGADPKICFQFLKDYPEAQQIFLTINYRSKPEIVEGAKRLISHNKNRFQKEIRAFINCNNEDDNKNNPLNIIQYPNEQKEYDMITNQLKTYMNEGRLSECAILFRTNMISPIFFQTLAKHKIPYRIKIKKHAWSEHTIVKDILAYLSMAQGDLSRKNFYRIMNKPVRYITRNMISEEQMSWEILEKNAAGMFSVLERIQKLRKELDYITKLPPIAAVGYIRRGIGYDKWLKDQGSKVWQDGDEILEMIKNLAGNCESISELTECICEVPDMDENKGEEGVWIMTYHGAKGLEWPIVILPDVMEGITPYKRAHTEDETEEERRMFYVALTRAKKQVYLYSVKEDKRHKKSPSVFLNEVKGE